ncbi:MAG: 4-hydroxythreonine-4-phosphate dehydrogenase PdxA [bacterium]
MITSGDPAGIGPELIIKLSRRAEFSECCSVVIGRVSLYRALFAAFSADASAINPVTGLSEADAGKLNIMEPPVKQGFKFGSSPGKESAKEAVSYLDFAAELIKKENLPYLLTAPVSKENISRIRKGFSGHTYYLADFFGVSRDEAAMLFLSSTLRVVTVTQHLPLSQVSSEIKKNRIVRIAVLACDALRGLGISKPRIAVCALNPHSGDGGLLGSEEKHEIIPAVKALKKTVADVRGPLNAEVAVVEALKNKFDLIVAMYHDQGILPVKLFSHGRGVNLTWGLPFIRVSPLHGPAFDIAGRDVAKEGSIVQSFKTLLEYRENSKIAK